MFWHNTLLFITRFLRQIINVKLLFFFISATLMISIIWSQTVYKEDQYLVNETLIKEVIKNVGRDANYAAVYRKKDKLPDDLKYFLLWTSKELAPMYYFGDGQRIFIDKKCPETNCYVTTDRNFLDGDVTRFDAIGFNGRNMKEDDLPENRSTHQKYIYFNTESAVNVPICGSVYDGFFNWTGTYRLNSDIPFPYIQVRDLAGNVVGPYQNVTWVTEKDEEFDIDDELWNSIKNKTKAAAWFVSHCNSKSGRDELVRKLQKELDAYDLTVDVYGKCGTFVCPRQKHANCDSMLEQTYYFYLSFENSFDEDYVTEKLLTPLNYNTVPIVFGGADYSRFLPPGSYLDARKMQPKALAEKMYQLTKSPEEYRKFFMWQKHYFFRDPSRTDSVCMLCSALNNSTLMEKETVYHELRKWWNPSSNNSC